MCSPWVRPASRIERPILRAAAWQLHTLAASLSLPEQEVERVLAAAHADAYGLNVAQVDGTLEQQLGLIALRRSVAMVFHARSPVLRFPNASV